MVEMEKSVLDRGLCEVNLPLLILAKRANDRRKPCPNMLTLKFWSIRNG